MTATAVRANAASRAEHIREVAADLSALDDPGAADGIIDALAQAVAAAIFCADGAALEAASAALRSAAGAWEGQAEWAEERGRLYGLADLIRWALQNLAAEAGARGIEPGTHAHEMLSLLTREDGELGEALNSGAIAKRLRVDKTQVSRTGRDLLERGLVVTSALGRKTYWEITPRGQYALERLPTAKPVVVPGEPLAIAVGDITDARAEQVAAGLTARHSDITAYVVSRRAGESAGAASAKRQPAPVMLIDGAGGPAGWTEALEREIASELKKPVTRLAVLAATEDGRVRTVLPQSAATARRRREGRVPAAR